MMCILKVGFNQGIAKGDIQGLNATVGANYLVKDNIKLGGFIHYDNKLGDLTKTHAHIGVIGVNGKFKLKDNKGEIESFIAYKYNYGKYQNKIDTYGNIDDMINKNIEKYYDESVHQHSIEIFNKYSKGFKIVKNLKISPQVENYLSISSSIKYSNIFVDDNKFDEIIYRFIGEKKENKMNDESPLFDKLSTSSDINHIVKNTTSGGVLLEYNGFKNLNIYLNTKLGINYENISITSRIKMEKYRDRNKNTESNINEEALTLDENIIEELKNSLTSENGLKLELDDFNIELNGDDNYIRDKKEFKWKDYINNIGIAYDIKTGVNYNFKKFNFDAYVRFDGNSNNNETLLKDFHKFSINTKIGYNW
ncbi:hypothetical protein [Streptobacillus moniliformis]|uniref:hypothetical protein n=1 Tax=Streptobacillus moniliformis TaxID=34105 RepID=UPI001F39B7BE|nr:hypothetical protein [Streptobacillus moniliformis]